MAHLVGVVDRDSRRRTEFMERAKAGLVPFGTQCTGAWDRGSVSLAWAASVTTPVSSDQDGNVGSVFVVGDVLVEESRGCSATQLLAQAKVGGLGTISGLNGFYLGCLVDPNGEVALATDLLGYFPLYYAIVSDRIFFASSPGLIKQLADAHFEPSPFGIAGVLLTMHIVDGQTIWKGIYRLSGGSMLHVHPQKGLSVVSGRRLEPSCRFFGLSLNESNEMLAAALETAVARYVRGRSVSVMLSGGLDSRLASGVLHAQGGQRLTAVTFGQRGDYEMICAAAVARCLGWRHIARREDYKQYSALARLQLGTEQLSNSFTDLAWWSGNSLFSELGKPVLTGFIGDSIMGGSHIDWGEDKVTGEYGFEPLYRRINGYGFSPAQVDQLIRRDFFGGRAADVKEALRAFYDALPGESFQKVWAFDLTHRQRFHVAPFAWRLSFGAWPLMPFADRDMIDLVGGMPRHLLVNRVAQTFMLKTRFPRLARLPLDTNSPSITPMVSSFMGDLHARISTSRFMDRFVYRWAERRNYYRVYDIDNPGWKEVRQLAELHRPALGRMFDLESLANLVPPNGMPLNLADPIVQGNAIKSLLGLMLLV